MKNLLFFLVVLPLICIGCTHDPEDITLYSTDSGTNSSLNGTTWIHTNEYEKWEFIQTLIFSETHCELIMEDYEVKMVECRKVKTLYSSQTLQGIYTYHNSKGIINIDGVEGTFSIHKKTLLIKGEEMTEEYIRK